MQTNHDRNSQLLGVGLASLWLVTLITLDMLIPGTTVVLSPLFGLAALIACAVVPVRGTTVVAAVAVVAAVVSGQWNHTWGSAQHLVRILDVFLTGSAAIVIASVRVHREQRHARVVAIAEVAQRAILPTLPRQVEQVALAARYQSAAQDTVVGGDLYDCYHASGRVRFLVGDVRGKGIAAVEQSARVIRAFRQSAGTKPTLADLAEDMTKYLAPFFDDEEFVTALLVDASEPAKITLVSCGHPPAMLVRPDGRVSLLDAPAGLPLGLGEVYDAVTVPWEAGDRLLMYTDGLSEARDASGEFIDLRSLAPLMTGAPVETTLNAVVNAVQDHIPGGRLTDDLAVMLLESNATAPAGPTDLGLSSRSQPTRPHDGDPVPTRG